MGYDDFKLATPPEYETTGRTPRCMCGCELVDGRRYCSEACWSRAASAKRIKQARLDAEVERLRAAGARGLAKARLR